MKRMLLAGVLALTALSPVRAADTEANKAVLRSLIEEMWNKHDLSAVDRYVAPDFIEHNKGRPPGIAGRKQYTEAVLAAFSDYHAGIEDVVAEGDIVVARIEFTGTQDGAYQGRPATHNQVRFTTADFYRVANGKIVEHWDVVDGLPRAIALGLVPAPQPVNTAAVPSSPRQ